MIIRYLDPQGIAQQPVVRRRFPNGKGRQLYHRLNLGPRKLTCAVKSGSENFLEPTTKRGNMR